MDSEEKKSYALGVAVGTQYQIMGITINESVFTKGFSDVINNRDIALPAKEMQSVLEALEDDIAKKGQAQIDAEQAVGRKFLAENKQKAGVNETQSGLQYKILRESIGKKPIATDTVEVHYQGKLLDGTIFDSSYERGKTIEFSLAKVIAGWTEGLQLMSEGSKFEFYVPAHLAYGDQGAGNVIKGGASLVFEIELFKVK
jgi:FKBP-type peptidyl-prolyl cis-trans isomerase FklB